jgi:hypothetical protein
MRPAALVTLVLSLSACRVHTLEDGAFSFNVGRILRDDCGLTGQPNLLGPGTLVTAGHEVTLALTQPQAELVGSYRADAEQMVLDGTSTNQQLRVRDGGCLVDVVTLHLETQTLDPLRFEGTMALTYDAKNSDACSCRFWFEFTAVRQ